MFQNMLVNGLVTPLCETNETSGWENRPFRTICPQQLQKTHKGQVTKTIKKKPKRARTAYTTDQLKVLETAYSCSRYINGQLRKELARQLNIEDKCIKIWFQNRRMKEKRDSESNCDSSSESFAPTSPKNTNNDSKDEIVINTDQAFETQPNLTGSYHPDPSVSPYLNHQALQTPAQFYNAVSSEYQYQSCQYGNYWQFNDYTPTTVSSDTNNEYPSEHYPNSQHNNTYETQNTNWAAELSDLINYLG